MKRWRDWKLDNPVVDFLLRLAIALPLDAIGLFFFAQAMKGGGFAAVVTIPLGALFFVLGAIPIAPWIAERFAGPAGNIFFPDRRFDRPQPTYSMAETKRVRGEFVEALEEYEGILADYPGDLRCFIAMLDIAATDLKDAALVERLVRRAREEVSSADMARIEEVYDELTRDFRDSA